MKKDERQISIVARPFYAILDRQLHGQHDDHM